MVWLVLEIFILMALTTLLGVVMGASARHGFAGRAPALAGIVPPTVAPGMATPPPAPVWAAADLGPSAPPPPVAEAPITADLTPVATAADPEPAPVAAPPAPAAAVDAAPAPVDSTPTDPAPAEPPPAVADGIIDAERAATADQVGVRPLALAGPRDGNTDDLKRIKGIGPQNEARLNALGIYHFAQIADWTVDEARWVGTYLAFPGRIEREKWIEQARALTG